MVYRPVLPCHLCLSLPKIRSMQIILFDIDGTLISTGGAGQSAMDVVSAETGTRPGDPAKLKYAGRTDKSIIRDHLLEFGIAETDENYAAYRERFLEKLPEHLAARDGYVLPHVENTLRRLDKESFEVGLITGNMRAAARLKLSHYGLADHFFTRRNGSYESEAMGGFGDHHFDRDDMARDALCDVQTRLGQHVTGAEIWVVGDTPRDVQCARAIGANVLAVATGSYSYDELRQTEPDILSHDLEQADEWWSAIGF